MASKIFEFEGMALVRENGAGIVINQQSLSDIMPAGLIKISIRMEGPDEEGEEE